tara:strand:- start:3051 stop:4946 length:1896 start_codon:yes stop_codon:yes gene_type:complete
MINKNNNLNEEINRIKSLFTEERLYGNLVEKELIIENPPQRMGDVINNKNDVKQLTDKERETIAHYLKNMDQGNNIDKINNITKNKETNLDEKSAEFCKPCTKPMSNSQVVDWYFNTSIPTKSQYEKSLNDARLNAEGYSEKVLDDMIKNTISIEEMVWVRTKDSDKPLDGAWRWINSLSTEEKIRVVNDFKRSRKKNKFENTKLIPDANNHCMVCHKFVGPFAMTKEQDPEGYELFERAMNTTNWLDDPHFILDVLSIVVLVIPVAGVFISAGIDLANAGLYYKEGDKEMAAFMLAVAVIPGGMGAWKLLYKKGITKQVNKSYKWALAEQKAGREVTKEALDEKLKKELGEKYFKNNKKLLDGYFNTIKAADSPVVKKSFESVAKVADKTPGYWKNFMKNGKTTQKFLKANGDDIYKAYLAYLKSVARKEMLIGMGLYTIIMSFGDELVTFALEEIPGAKEWLVAKRKENLKKDADKGNISSIVRVAGYPWPGTREIFMVTPYKKNKDQNVADNTLLKKAWRSGWRPYDKNNPDILIIPDEEFWTPKMKEFHEEQQKKLEDKIDKEGVIDKDINIQVVDGDRKLVFDDIPQGIDYDINKSAFSLDSLNMISPDNQKAFDDILKGELDKDK